MSNRLRSSKRKAIKNFSYEQYTREKIRNHKKRNHDMILREFQEKWKELVRANVNPRWPKMAKFVPPEWYFNFIKGICESLYGEEAIRKMMDIASHGRWPHWRFKLNELPRKCIANILFTILLRWLMHINRKLITLGITVSITYPKKGYIKQVIKFHGKVIEEKEVKYA